MRKLYLLLLLCMVCSGLVTQAQTVTIGTGTSATLTNGIGSTSLQSPYNSYYGYSYVQTLYLKSEINVAGNITSIKYYFTGSSLANSNELKIYMGNVTRSSFATVADWEPLANLTLVFDGTISPGTLPGWVTINLSTPFAYNNTSNLLIAVDENKDGYEGTAGYRASNLGMNRVIFFRDDDAPNNPDPASPPTADGRSSYVGNIQIEFTAGNCYPVTGVNISNITSSTATANWTAPSSGSPVAYNWELRTSGAAGSGPTGLVASGDTAAGNIAVDLSSLTATTTYHFYVQTDCGSGNMSNWSSDVQFSTPCNTVTSFPFTESFNAVTMPPCWTQEYVSASNNWTFVTANGNNSISPRTGARMAEFRMSGFGSKTKLITPVLDITGLTAPELKFYFANVGWGGDIDALRVFYKNSAGGTWTQIGTDYITEHTTWTEVILSLPNPSNDYYIAFEATSNYGRGLNLDDVTIGEGPSCSAPTNLITSGITATDAQVDWTPPSTGTITDYYWELRTSGAAGSGATGLVASGSTANTNVSFATLTGGTAYTFYVRTNCINPDVSTYASVIFTTPPPNDGCMSATMLSFSNAVNGTTVAANATPSMPALACSGMAGFADDDVWYTFTPPVNGDVTIKLTNASANLDAVIEVYSGSCGSLSLEGCIDGTGNAGNETLIINGATAGTDYYFRVYSYDDGAGAMGTFTIEIISSVLPVSLIEFKGEITGSINKLSWETATETNNKGFELQRSADGKNFSSLAFVASKGDNGNSTSVLNYNYNDEKPLGGTNYYRLKQIDKDSKFTYSNTVVLKSKVTDIRFASVYPNPVTSEVNMIITSPVAEKVTIVVTDLQGRILMQQRTQLATGENQSRFNVQSLAAGTYLIKAICANGCETAVQRFVKQ